MVKYPPDTFGTAATTNTPATNFCSVAVIMLLPVIGRLTRTEFFGAAAVPATVAVPLRLNCALPVTCSAMAFALFAKTPTPLALSPRTPVPMAVLAPVSPCTPLALFEPPSTPLPVPEKPNTPLPPPVLSPYTPLAPEPAVRPWTPSPPPVLSPTTAAKELLAVSPFTPFACPLPKTPSSPAPAPSPYTPTVSLLEGEEFVELMPTSPAEPSVAVATKAGPLPSLSTSVRPASQFVPLLPGQSAPRMIGWPLSACAEPPATPRDTPSTATMRGAPTARSTRPVFRFLCCAILAASC